MGKPLIKNNGKEYYRPQFNLLISVRRANEQLKQRSPEHVID